MRVIYGGRCTGKTTKLIKHASETGSMIVASTTAEKRCIQEKAKQMYEIKMIANPYICVVTPSELKDYSNDAKVVVDNAEYVLQNLLGCQIDAIAINMGNKCSLTVENVLNHIKKCQICYADYTDVSMELQNIINWINIHMEDGE